MVLQRHAIFCMLALLACAGSMASSEAENEPLQYTEKFWSSKIGLQMLQINDNMKKAMSGALKQQPAQSPKKVRQQACHRNIVSSSLFGLPRGLLARPGWNFAVANMYQWVSSPRWRLQGPAGGMQPPTMPKRPLKDTTSVAQQGFSRLCFDLHTHTPPCLMDTRLPCCCLLRTGFCQLPEQRGPISSQLEDVVPRRTRHSHTLG